MSPYLNARGFLVPSKVLVELSECSDWVFLIPL